MYEESTMTQTMNTDTLNNAEEIIERFGGIRPMSTKTDIPVTTIQGWKKRGAIPAARLDDLLKAARNHNLSLEDLVGKTSAPANENGTKIELSPTPQPTYKPQTLKVESTREHDKLKVAMVMERQKALVQSVILSVVLIAIIAGAGAMLLWPEFQETKRTTLQNSQTIAALEQDVGAVKSEIEETQSMFSGYLPSDWQEQIESLRVQAEQAQASVEQAMQKAEQISEGVIGANAGTIQERVATLGQSVAEMTHSPMLQGLIAKFGTISASPEGSSMLDQSVQELNALLQTAPQTETPIETTLETARTQSTTLGQTFEGVPAQELKAAALLLGFSQFRSSLGRDNESFADDLSLMKTLLGQDNPALAEAIDRLAPQAAESGVLTPAGLATELQTMTGDIVVASLKGEDVSVSEKAQAHFGNILKVEKDGEMVTGTPVQQKLAKADTLMQGGNLEQAIAEVSTLEGPAADLVQPWLQKARSTLQAQNLGSLLEGGIMETISGAGAGGLPAGGQLIEDKASGVILYKPATKFAPPKAAFTP